MEFGFREIGILVGAILIAAVLFDGWRRTRQSKKGDLPFKFPTDSTEERADPLMPGQDPVQQDIFHEDLVEPDLLGSITDPDLGLDDISEPRPVSGGSIQGFDEPSAPSPMTPPRPPIMATQPVSAPEPITAPDDGLSEGIIGQPRPKPAQAPTPAATEQPIQADVLTVFVRPQKGVFKGVELRNALVSMGLSYGDRSLYHRHSGSGRDVLYSVANASAEGTFPEGAMEGFTSPGVLLLIELSNHPDPEHGFEEMISSARQMGRRLGAEVLDSNQQPLQLSFLTAAKARVKEVAKQQRNGAGTLG